jgi:hypothetical protein
MRQKLRLVFWPFRSRSKQCDHEKFNSLLTSRGDSEPCYRSKTKKMCVANSVHLNHHQTGWENFFCFQLSLRELCTGWRWPTSRKPPVLINLIVRYPLRFEFELPHLKLGTLRPSNYVKMEFAGPYHIFFF